MLRHPALAVALFLSASCELAGAPPAHTAKPPPPQPSPSPTPDPDPDPAVSARTQPAPVEEIEYRGPMTRGGPSWGKEKQRFKVKGTPTDDLLKPLATEPAPAPPAKPTSAP